MPGVLNSFEHLFRALEAGDRQRRPSSDVENHRAVKQGNESDFFPFDNPRCFSPYEQRNLVKVQQQKLIPHGAGYAVNFSACAVIRRAGGGVLALVWFRKLLIFSPSQASPLCM